MSRTIVLKARTYLDRNGHGKPLPRLITSLIWALGISASEAKAVAISWMLYKDVLV